MRLLICFVHNNAFRRLASMHLRNTFPKKEPTIQRNIRNMHRTDAENIGLTKENMFVSAASTATWTSKQLTLHQIFLLLFVMGDSSDEDDWGGPKAQIGLQELVLWSWHAIAQRQWRHVATCLSKNVGTVASILFCVSMSEGRVGWNKRTRTSMLKSSAGFVGAAESPSHQQNWSAFNRCASNWEGQNAAGGVNS